MTKTDLATIDITGATEAGGTVTVTVDDATTLTNSDSVTLTGVVGMTDLNDTYTIAIVDYDNETFEVTQATAQSYTSGGIVAIN